MPLKDQIKNYARKVVEDRPDEDALCKMVRVRWPVATAFGDEGIVPNNPRVPFVVYRGAVDLTKKSGFEPGTVVDALFQQNAWGRSWRDTIYDFVHYHSQIHEAMGVARGHAVIEFGGIKGRPLRLKAGEVAMDSFSASRAAILIVPVRIFTPPTPSQPCPGCRLQNSRTYL